MSHPERTLPTMKVCPICGTPLETREVQRDPSGRTFTTDDYCPACQATRQPQKF